MNVRGLKWTKIMYRRAIITVRVCVYIYIYIYIYMNDYCSTCAFMHNFILIGVGVFFVKRCKISYVLYFVRFCKSLCGCSKSWIFQNVILYSFVSLQNQQVRYDIKCDWLHLGLTAVLPQSRWKNAFCLGFACAIH